MNINSQNRVVKNIRAKLKSNIVNNNIQNKSLDHDILNNIKKNNDNCVIEEELNETEKEISFNITPDEEEIKNDLQMHYRKENESKKIYINID
jgi:hypothetical protein